MRCARADAGHHSFSFAASLSHPHPHPSAADPDAPSFANPLTAPLADAHGDLDANADSDPDTAAYGNAAF